MPTPKEASAIAAIFTAANKLSNDYARSGGAENRRDQIKAFLASVVNAAADLADAYDHDLIDVSYMRPDVDLVCQSVDVAFMDAVEDEEAAEPDYSRPYSTLYVQGGSVVG